MRVRPFTIGTANGVERPLGLFSDLARFDGKSVAVLEAIRVATPPDPEVIDALVAMIGTEEKNVQTGASWLIRSYLSGGAHITPAQVGRLAASLPAMHDGFGRLHLCQAMDHLTVPPEHAEAFADFCRSCQATKNTFLRAWAPHGFFRLGLQHEAYLAEARAAVEIALTDPAPSVRARARKTLAGE